MLPVDTLRAQMVHHLTTGNRLVLTAPTGSGKSTRVPVFLCDDVVPEGKQVWVLQPRRMAARMLSQFVAGSRGGILGDEVGYCIRFESAASSRTRILFLTEGVLLRRLLGGELPERVGALVFDEFHERHLESDITLALALRLQQKFPDLKVVVMSATLNAASVATYMGRCPVLEAAGRSYPVHISYLKVPDPRPVWDVAAGALCRMMPQLSQGAVLVFMPGSFEIRRTMQAIAQCSSLNGIPVFPLYGSLSSLEQDLAVQDRGGCRIIVSTNVAETSLTIPGVVGVVDSGLVRMARFDHLRGIDTLYVQSNSLSSVEQRAGRAGRTGPGWCVRLWTETVHEQRPPQEVPEIQRVDISSVVLSLLASGTELSEFEWFERPDDSRVQQALSLLHTLGAISSQSVTETGQRMARLPVAPRFARLLVEAQLKECLPAACVLVALAQSAGLLRPFDSEEQKQECRHYFGSPDSDLILEYHVWIWARNMRYEPGACARWGVSSAEARRAEQAALQLLRETAQTSFGARQTRRSTNNTHSHPPCLPTEPATPEEQDRLRYCILAGFSDRIALRVASGSPHYKLIQGVGGQLLPQSVVTEASLVVATEIEEVQRQRSTEIRLRKVTAVESHWVRQLMAADIRKVSNVRFVSSMGRVMSVEEEWLQEVMLASVVRETADDDAAAEVLSGLILEGSVSLPLWSPAVEHFISRVNFAALHGVDYGIPPVDEAARVWIIQQLVLGARSIRELERRDPWTVLRSWLSEGQKATVDYLAPESIAFPNRKRPAKLRYEASGEVVLSETIQYLYDCPTPVCVAQGKVPVLFEILSPARRPVQVTRSLENFWSGSYLDIKKQLKGRYPKHEWR